MVSPVVPEYVLQSLRIERERQLAFAANVAEYHTDRRLPTALARPVAGLGAFLVLMGNRMQAAAAPRHFAPCVGCGD